MKKTVKVCTALDGMSADWQTHKTAFDIVINENFTMSGDYFKCFMFQNFSEWSYFVRSDTQYIAEFKQLFIDFKTMNERGIKRIYDTLTDEYNPLHNYDRTERHETSYTGKEVNENTKSGNITDNVSYNGSEKNEYTQSGTETTTENNGARLNTNSVAPYETSTLTTSLADSESASVDSSTKAFENRKDTDEKTYNNRADNRTTSYNNVVDSSEKSFDERKDVEEIVVYGNIGTTKSTEMASDEIELRVGKALYKIIYEWFVHDNLFLI